MFNNLMNMLMRIMDVALNVSKFTANNSVSEGATIQ